MKNIKNITIVIITLYSLFSGNYLFPQQFQNLIDFEHSGLYTDGEGDKVDNDYFKVNYKVTFHLSSVFNNNPANLPEIAQVGSPANGFISNPPGGYDRLKNPGNFGEFFLTDPRRPGTGTLTSNLYIKYHDKKCSEASGFFFDIDDHPSQYQPESWTINVYKTGSNNPVVTELLYSDDFADHQSPQLPHLNVGDGIATPWSVSLPTGDYIDYIEFIYNDTIRGGIGFDNFSFCSIDTNTSINEMDTCCEEVISTADCLFTNKLNFSTGYNPLTNSLISVGDIDPLWRLMNIPPTTSSVSTCNPTIDNAYSIFGLGSGSDWNRIPGASILSPCTTAGFGADNLFETQPWRFRRIFCVCDSTEVRISGSYRADDKGELVLREMNNFGNSIVISQTTNPHHSSATYCWGCWSSTSFDTTINLQCGTYCFEFNLLNVNGIKMGFSLNGEISDINNNNNLLNPTDVCCNSGSINGQKILDNNCNGIKDANDDPGAGWTFELYDVSGILYATTVTNSNGEFFFTNLPLSSYHIKEIAQAGWVPNIPHGGFQNVTLTQNNPNVFVDFLNCIFTPSPCCDIENLELKFPLSGTTIDYNSYYGFSYNQSISLGNSEIEEIRASIISYELDYSNDECAKCYNQYSYNGTFVLQKSPVLIGNLQKQSLPHYSIGSQIPRTFNNGVREIIWKGMPSVLGNISIPFEILFPKPILPDCCNVTVKTCIKFVFKDVDCNICEKYICLEFDKNGIKFKK